MIINSSKVKSEALLLFCRDLINSYKDIDDELYTDKIELKKFIDIRTKQLLKAINSTIQPTDYYTRNLRVSRISIIFKTYQYINSMISKQLQNGSIFNPSMLCFTLLSTWFAELTHGENHKEFLFFYIYPYSEIYDKLLLNLNDPEYKSLNLAMLNIAENTMLNLNNYRFK